MKIISRYFLWLAMGLAFIPSFAQAEKYALLVGVSEYLAADNDLEGPANDVTSMQDALLHGWGFERERVISLVNEQATKHRILQELDHLYERSEPGDQLLFYFSGHGTSGKDIEAGLPMPDGTGALLPYDTVVTADKKAVVKSLIVGRSDLRPRFKKLDETGRFLTVIVDACYSGNAVRGGIGNKWVSRNAQLNLGTVFEMDDDIGSFGSETKSQGAPFPYDNVYFLAASGEHEEAIDIGHLILRQYPTYDNKPHGAFSDSLIRLLNGDLPNIDRNHDKNLAHAEVKNAIAQHMKGRGYPHTPQNLPATEEDKNQLALRTFFGKSGYTPQKTLRPDERLKLAIDGPVDENIQKSVAEVLGVELVNNPPVDIRLNQSSSAFELRNTAHDLMIAYSLNQSHELINRIKQQVWLHRFIALDPEKQKFNLSLDITGRMRNSPLKRGEKVGITLKSEQDAYFLLLDIDSEGGINIMLPFISEEQKLYPANIPYQVPESDVVPPFGVDQLVLFAFTRRPDHLFDWLGNHPARIEPGAIRMLELNELIRKYEAYSAVQSLELITVDKE